MFGILHQCQPKQVIIGNGKEGKLDDLIRNYSDFFSTTNVFVTDVVNYVVLNDGLKTGL